MAFVVGEVSAPVSADPSKFNQAMDDVKKAGEKTANAVSDSFTKLSKKMETIGKNLTKYVTLPIIGVGTAALFPSLIGRLKRNGRYEVAKGFIRFHPS